MMIRTEAITPNEVLTETFFGVLLGDSKFTEAGGYTVVFNSLDEIVEFDHHGLNAFFEVNDTVDFYDARFIVQDLINGHYSIRFYIKPVLE